MYTAGKHPQQKIEKFNLLKINLFFSLNKITFGQNKSKTREITHIFW
jgi:hypothetical protein